MQYTFKDIQKFSKLDLINMFGDYGVTLFNCARGIDNREVNSTRVRKSLSVERTFSENINREEELNKHKWDVPYYFGKIMNFILLREIE